MRGSLDPRILWLTAAVTLWTAGFDIIYACQDYAFDVADRPLQHAAAASASPARCGSRACCTSGCWSACCCWSGILRLGALAWRASPPSPALLLWEHRLVKADDLSRIDAAFFTMNGYVSVIFFVFLGRRHLLLTMNIQSFEDPRLEPIRDKVEAGERLIFDDGLTLYRSPRSARRRLDGEPGARAPARRQDLFQRQPPHQSHRRLRGQLPPVRFRQASQGSQGLHDVARTGLGDAPATAGAKRSPNSTSSAACIPN